MFFASKSPVGAISTHVKADHWRIRKLNTAPANYYCFYNHPLKSTGWKSNLSVKLNADQVHGDVPRYHFSIFLQKVWFWITHVLYYYQSPISLQVLAKSTANPGPWWRHQMETFSALLALCEGNPSVTGGFPSQKPVTRNFGVLFDLRLNKRLSKNRNAGDLSRHRAQYDVIVIGITFESSLLSLPP